MDICKSFELLQVTILISPAKRAYSWYQHTRVHRDPIALNYSFYDIISATDTAPKVLRDLRNRYPTFHNSFSLGVLPKSPLDLYFFYKIPKCPAVDHCVGVRRCLNPGKYAQHLERWLTYYSPQQLHIIDGDQLRSNPIQVMDSLQKFLKITPFFDYSSHLRSVTLEINSS